MTYLGKPPGVLKPLMRLWRPSRSRVYLGQKVEREFSSQRDARIAGAPWPGPTTRRAF